MTVRSSAAGRYALRVMRAVRSLAADESGGTAIEYSLLAAMVSVAAIGAMKGLGTSVTNTWNYSSNAIGNSMK